MMDKQKHDKDRKIADRCIDKQKRQMLMNRQTDHSKEMDGQTESK